MRMRSPLSPLMALSLALTATSCASDASSSGSADAASAGTDTSGAPVSFADEVVPLLSRACSQSSCHGSGSGQLKLEKGNATQNYAALVNVASAELPTMARVSPGKPAESYLLHKVEGTQGSLDAQCVGGTCQSAMPQGGLLDAEDQALLRRWITEGAAN